MKLHHKKHYTNHLELNYCIGDRFFCLADKVTYFKSDDNFLTRFRGIFMATESTLRLFSLFYKSTTFCWYGEQIKVDHFTDSSDVLLLCIQSKMTEQIKFISLSSRKYARVLKAIKITNEGLFLHFQFSCFFLSKFFSDLSYTFDIFCFCKFAFLFNTI